MQNWQIAKIILKILFSYQTQLRSNHQPTRWQECEHDQVTVHKSPFAKGVGESPLSPTPFAKGLPV